MQVITRTSGLQLGIISHFLVDPRTATVVYLNLRAKGLGGQDMGMVPLSALTQIGDVVLVHDESAVMDDDLRSRGLVKLVGHSVQSYDGTPLGKVRPAHGSIAFTPYFLIHAAVSKTSAHEKGLCMSDFLRQSYRPSMQAASYSLVRGRPQQTVRLMCVMVKRRRMSFLHAWAPQSALVLPAQVRDFAFSPDSGQVTHLSYDNLGLPTVPEALLNVYEVDMESVLELRSGLVVLRRGAEKSTILVSSGILGYALDRVKVGAEPPPAKNPLQSLV